MRRKLPMKHICLAVLILLLAPLSSYALVITSPQNGTAFKEGDTVELIAELTPDDPELIESVHFIVSGITNACAGAIRTHPKYKCNFILPTGSPRSITLMAYAVTSPGVVDAQEIKINVGLPSSLVLRELKSDMGDRLFFSRLTQKRQIYVKGEYSDGVERDLRLGQAGTTYVSNNEKVATVNADGLATAVGSGTAQITVRNGDKKLVLDVVVKPK